MASSLEEPFLAACLCRALALHEPLKSRRSQYLLRPRERELNKSASYNLPSPRLSATAKHSGLKQYPPRRDWLTSDDQSVQQMTNQPEDKGKRAPFMKGCVLARKGSKGEWTGRGEERQGGEGRKGLLYISI